MRGSVALIALLVAGGCLDPLAYPCDSVTQCAVDGKDGTCNVDGWCVYPDTACPSGRRYGPAAGDGLADECTQADTFGGSASGTSSGSTSLGEGDSTGACGGCIAPPGPCFASSGVCNGESCEYEPLAAGMPCVDDEPCTFDETCDGDGVCVPGETIVCDTPPALDVLCYENPGTCNAAGECVYPPLAEGEDCEDGNACTLDDKCDGQGHCVSGETCESDDGCNVGVCMAGECMLMPVADGTSCGANPADRCCAGTCVDISTDMGNCGGCGAACQSDEVCESVAATLECDPHPASTTGRCTCNGETSDCPHGQVCRTVSPAANRCAPEDMADCPGGVFHNVDLCPNYCE
ncbi:MAG TPA: hypothetical protein VFG69_18105 [Nannocystaceae bacterium]|nr:hypothetical protein [Nannocystaceae bacterium]